MILRITYGLANNYADMAVPDTFNMLAWKAQVIGDGGVTMPNLWIPLRWVQHVMLMTPEQATETIVQGATKQ